MNLAHILPWALLEGIELLTKGIKCHYYAIMLIQCLEDVIQGGVLTWTPGQVSQEPLQQSEDIRQQVLVYPTWVVENSHIPLPWVVSYSIFGLFILEDQQVNLHPKTLPAHTDWLLSLDILIMVNCWELWLLPQLELPSPEEGEQP